jgi:UDP-N-acetyl-D-glucosamine dehydrogenase
VKHWWELEKQDSYPADGQRRGKYFRNQEKLSELHVLQNLEEVVKSSDAVVLAVRHRPYLNLDADEVCKMVGKPFAIIDCFGILNDSNIRRYFELGCEVKGLGRGQIQRIKEQVRGPH